MRKHLAIPIIALLIVVVSCNKSETKTKCYECQVSGWGPTPPSVQEKCTNQIDTVQFQDQFGNQLQSVCTEK